MTARPVLLYDADCRFCRFAARAAARLDRGLALLPLQEGAALLPDLTESERMASIHLVAADGTRRSRGDALTALGLPAALGRLYEPVARRRRVLGRIVPDGLAPRRFP